MKKKKKNIVLEQVLVENYAAEGKSLARREGKVIFIEGAVPGDVVDVRLGKSKKDWAEGYPLRFHSYSKERATPFCQHFGVCGGCQWQMLPYEKQLEFKHQQVIDNLTRIAKVQLPEFFPIIGAAVDKFYRNKLEFTFSTKEYTPNKPPSRNGRNAADAQGGQKQDAGSFSASSQNETLQHSISFSSTEDRGDVGALGFHAKGFFDKIVEIQKCWLLPQ